MDEEALYFTFSSFKDKNQNYNGSITKINKNKSVNLDDLEPPAWHFNGKGQRD